MEREHSDTSGPLVSQKNRTSPRQNRTRQYREQNGKLYAKVPRKGFVVVAEDKTSRGAGLLVGKILLGSKKLQKSSSPNGVTTDLDRTDER